MAIDTNHPATPSLPNPDSVQTPSISEGIRKKLFFGVLALLALVLLANVFGPSAAPPTSPAAAREQKRTPQTPTVQQVTELKKSIDDSARLLEENIQRDAQVAQQREGDKQTLAQLQAQDALRDAEQQRAVFDASQRYGTNGRSADPQQVKMQRAEQAYKSLFADNRVTQTGAPVSFTQAEKLASTEVGPPPAAQPLDPADRALQRLTQIAGNREQPQPQQIPPVEQKRRPLDFDPNAQPLYWLPEGSIIEAELTNRLDGDQPGPVNVMVTNDVYKPGTRLVLIPQGARGMGEAKQVAGFGQQRLAVAFHRILTPGLDGYGIPLDKLDPGLAQAGEAGLHDRVNSHYASIFGASLAVGAIGGLAQIGNNAASLTSLSEFQSGVSSSTAQSADRILDRFLNRLPTIIIREGTRVKIILTDDLALPAYQPKGE